MQPGMRVTPETLRIHIQVLKKYFDIVDLNDWVHRNKTNQALPNKAVAITFDDGWVDNYEFAFPILKSENVPATIFLVSSMIGFRKQFWPERVASIIEALKNNNGVEVLPEYVHWFEAHGVDVKSLESLGEKKQEKLITDLKKFPDEEICERLKVFETLEAKIQQGALSQMLNYEQLKEMKASSLISFGAHTRHHYRLDKVTSSSTLEDEIVNCKQDLESSLGMTVNGFCYPNGDFDDKSISLVRATYEYACTTRKGWNTQVLDRCLMNRILLHEDVSSDRISFEAKISGLL